MAGLESTPLFVLQIEKIRPFDEKTGTFSETAFFTRPLISVSENEKEQQVFKPILDKINELVPKEDLNFQLNYD